MGRRIGRAGLVNAEIATIDIPPDRWTAYRSETAEEIAASLLRFTVLPRIEIATLADGRYRLVDGLHRLEAFRMIGGTHVPARLVFEMNGEEWR